MKITKGQIIAITTGEYSDYCLRDHLRALKDFDSDDEATRFKAGPDYLAAPSWSSDPDERTAYESDDRFLAWVIREGLVEPLSGEVVELHISDYSRLDIGREPEGGAA